MIDKAVRRAKLPDFNEDSMKEEVFETGGIVFPDGQCIELIRGKYGNLSLFDTRRERSGRTYIPPSLHASILEVLTLPTGRVSCGSTAELFQKIHSVFVDHGISDEASKLFAYYGISTWFPESLPIAPCLVITGPRAEANVALQILTCVVRHALPLGDINLAGFRALPMHLQPTLLVSNLQRSMCRTLSMSTYPQAYVQCGSGLIDVYCAKVVYAGTTTLDGFAGDTVLRINLAPCHNKLPVVSPATRQAIAAYLQPRLLDYRVKYVVRVRDSNFDIPTFSSDLRMLVRAVGACIVDAPDLQAGVAPLLEDQEELLGANRWVDPQCIVLEAMLAQCHIEVGPSRLGVGQIADVATEILASRGEKSRLEAKPTGNYTRMLGFSPKRDSQGYALILTDDLRRKIHRLSRDYQVEVVDQAGVNCLHCGELAAAGDGSLETRPSQVK